MEGIGLVEEEEVKTKEKLEEVVEVEEIDEFGTKKTSEGGPKPEIEELEMKKMKERDILEEETLLSKGESGEDERSELLEKSDVKEETSTEFHKGSQKPSYTTSGSETKAGDEEIVNSSVSPDICVEEKPKGSSTIPKSGKSPILPEKSTEKKASKESTLYPRLSPERKQEAIAMDTSSDEGIIHTESEKLLGLDPPSTQPMMPGSQMRSRSLKGHSKNASSKNGRSKKGDANSRAVRKILRCIWKNFPLIISLLGFSIVTCTSIASIIINAKLDSYVRSVMEHAMPCMEHVEYIVSNSCANITREIEEEQRSVDLNLALDRDTRDLLSVQQNGREISREFASFNNLEVIGESAENPAESCASLKEIRPLLVSGFYWLTSTEDHAVFRYCDMELSCGGIPGGWMRVAHIDTRDVTSRCPSGFISKKETITNYDPMVKGCSLDTIRMCVIESDRAMSCSSTSFSSSNTYSKVCGRIIGYQFGSPDAFNSSSDKDYFKYGVSKFYVDGITLTYSSQQKHIWTFAAAYNKKFAPLLCHCEKDSNSTKGFAKFIRKNYFCDTAVEFGNPQPRLYLDPLWDGNGCGQDDIECCSTNSSPPWFYRELPATSDDITMTMCRDQERNDEDIGIQIVDILVQ